MEACFDFLFKRIGIILAYPYAFRIQQEKAGCFTTRIVEGKIILTTFLFLTNNSTPEGDALYNNKGITRNDKSYLAIDKLSSFVNSDIKTNERVKKKMADFVEQYLQLTPLNA